MTTKDWIYISLISIGVMVLTRKAFSSEANSIVNALENANPASLPITLTSGELNVMQYADIMMYEGQKQGIAPELIAGIMLNESSGAASQITKESSVNSYSYGLMQVLIETAAWLKKLNTWLKYNGNPQTLLQPDVNIEIGTSYLAYQYRRYTKNPVINPITDMIASYNAGTAFTDGNYGYTNSKGDPKVQAYVDRVMNYKFRFRMMFEYLYSNYDELFPASIWGH
jgi:soluble lytic murein transglycosylase-like protein